MNDNKFVNAVRKEPNTFTDNGAPARNTTNRLLVDLFGTIGAWRALSEKEIIDRFIPYYDQDKLHALRLLFWTRDIRGGAGERRTFKVLLKYLADYDTDNIVKNIPHIAEYGRWDDLYCLVDTAAKEYTYTVMYKQLLEDIENYNNKKSISLLAKWLKSAQLPLGKETAESFDMTVQEYRKILSLLRGYLNVVEKKMSAREFDSIDFEKVPSKAMQKYRNCFSTKCEKTYNEYLAKLESGEAKVNAGAVYPYEITRKMLVELYNGSRDSNNSKLLNAQWKALPNYCDSDKNVMVISDVSGSMECGNVSARPLDVSISLGLYCAERNHGAFKNLLMLFTTEAEYFEVKHDNLYDNVHALSRANWGGSTNFYGAMMRILKTAVDNKVPQEDVPEALIVVSDMQFNTADCGNTRYSYDKSYSLMHDIVKKEYEDAGYKMPRMVYWNVNATNPVFHTTADEMGVQYASGASPALFKNILNNIEVSAYDLAIAIIDGERYQRITLKD